MNWRLWASVYICVFSWNPYNKGFSRCFVCIYTRVRMSLLAAFYFRNWGWLCGFCFVSFIFAVVSLMIFLFCMFFYYFQHLHFYSTRIAPLTRGLTITALSVNAFMSLFAFCQELFYFVPVVGFAGRTNNSYRPRFKRNVCI